MNTDLVTGVSDHATDTLFVLFNTDEGRKYLIERRGIDADLVADVQQFRPVQPCATCWRRSRPPNISISVQDDMVIVGRDRRRRHVWQRDRKATVRYFGNRLDAVSAGETWGRSLVAATTDHLIELNQIDRQRIFNLGYFTWVEQQGVSLEDFNARAKQSFWDGLLELVPAWDAMIADVQCARAARPSR